MEMPFSARILVLNRLWQAVNIVGVERGFSLLFQEHAKVIDSTLGDFQVYDRSDWIAFSVENPPGDGQEVVRTVSLRLRVPKILLLNEFDRLPMKEVRFTREHLFERDNYVCQYCCKSFKHRQLNLDHVIPRDRGGKTSWENIVTSCISCNAKKANRLPHEAGMYLRHKPGRPRKRTFVSFLLEREVDDSWKHFLPGYK